MAKKKTTTRTRTPRKVAIAEILTEIKEGTEIPADKKKEAVAYLKSICVEKRMTSKNVKTKVVDGEKTITKEEKKSVETYKYTTDQLKKKIYAKFVKPTKPTTEDDILSLFGEE